MTPQPKKRNRAVRLTPTGLAQLENAIAARWAESGQQRKLTREIQADYLGVAEKTVSQILSCRGVDRSTLKHAFARLKIDWSDSYCELVQEESQLEPPTTPHRPRWHRWVAFLCAGFVLGGVFAAQRLSSTDINQGLQPRQIDFKQLLNRGTDLYNRGRYKESEQLLTRAAGIAREWQDAGDYASALRMLGDVNRAQGRLTAAEGYYRKSLKYREEFSVPSSQPSLHEALGV